MPSSYSGGWLFSTLINWRFGKDGLTGKSYQLITDAYCLPIMHIIESTGNMVAILATTEPKNAYKKRGDPERSHLSYKPDPWI